MLAVLEKLKLPVKRAVFVSGFLHRLGNDTFDKINQTFYERDIDWQTIKQNCEKALVLHGDNDPYVPLSEAEELADKLDCQLRVIKDGGHLNQSAGFVEFPELLESIVES